MNWDQFLGESKAYDHAPGTKTRDQQSEAQSGYGNAGDPECNDPP